MHTSTADLRPALFRAGDIGVSSEWRDLTYDWWPLLTAEGVFTYSYLRDLFDKQRALRPFILSPEGPPKQRMQRVLQRRTEYGVQGPEYLLETVGLLAIDVQRGASPDPSRPRHTTITNYVVGYLERAVLDGDMLGRVLDALMIGLAPPDQPLTQRQKRAQAAIRSLSLGGMLQNEDPQYLFEPDGAWVLLLPRLIGDERWVALFTQLHGVDALRTYRDQARAWVEFARRRAERLTAENNRIRDHLLAAQRRPLYPVEATATPRTEAVCAASVPPAAPATRPPHVPDAVPAATPASPPARSVTRQAAGTPRDRTWQTAPAPLTHSVPPESQPTDQTDDPWRRGHEIDLSPRTRSVDVPGTADPLPALAPPSDRAVVAAHLRDAELATGRIDGYFWIAVQQILQDDSNERYAYTPGERKAVQRLLTRRSLPIGVILAALRALMALPTLTRPQRLSDLLKLDLFHTSLESAAALVAAPVAPSATGGSWAEFMAVYRSIGLTASLRNVSPTEWPLIADLFERQPVACWEVLRRVQHMPAPPQLSYEYLKRAVLNNQRAQTIEALQGGTGVGCAPARTRTMKRASAPSATPSPREATPTDPRRALLEREGIHPGILTPSMTVELIEAWIAEADARGAAIARRAGWLAWGIKKETLPQDVAELGLRHIAAAQPATDGAAALSAQPEGAPHEAAAQPAHACWSGVLQQLQRMIPPSEFDVWLKESVLITFDDRRAVIGVSNIFTRERLETCYHTAIQTSLQVELGYPVELQIVIGCT